MDTRTEWVSREASELYISKINSLIAAGRESLIGGIVSEYEQAGHLVESTHVNPWLAAAGVES